MSIRRLAVGLLLYLAAGSALTVLVSFALAGWLDLRQATPQNASRVSGDERWEVTRWDRPGASAVLSVRHLGLNWSPRQATGPPDTPGAGDQVTAWATSAQDAPGEWLEPVYARAVVPRSVRVYETLAPGAVCRVTAFRADGGEVDAWRGADPTPTTAASGVSDIPLSIDFPTTRVRLYLASEKVPGWNEIDAVGLVGPGSELQWATDARASSFYGGGSVTDSATTPAPAEIVPAWSRLDRAGLAREPARVGDEARVADARGWPMLALCSRRALPGPVPAPDASALWGAAPLSSIPTSSTIYTYSSLTSFVSAGGTLSPAGLPPAAMPLRPVWPGFAADAAFYGASLALLRWVLTAPRRLVREVSRMRMGRCIACGYDLGYDFIRGCPECGWRRPAGAADANASPGGNGRVDEGLRTTRSPPS